MKKALAGVFPLVGRHLQSLELAGGHLVGQR